MANIADRLIDLLGHNPSLTPWVLLIIVLVLFAMAMGRAGKAALGNVQTLLEQGEALNDRMQKELHRKDDIIAARDKYIRELEDDRQTTIDFVTNLRRDQAELYDKIFELERTNRGLIEDYHKTLGLLEDEREKKKDSPHG